jgi:plasmid stabilization system protein ParE
LQAATDIEQAMAWYESRVPGLGERFLSALDECLSRIAANPRGYPLVYPPYRRALLHRFPYGVYFEAAPDQVFVDAVFHLVRNPAMLQQRLH